MTRPPLRLRRDDIAQFAIAVAWLVLFAHQIGQAKRLGYVDTTEYRRIAALLLSDARFFLGARPFTLPLLIKLAGGDDTLVAIQIALYAVGWLGLARAVAQLARRAALRVALFALLLVLAICTDLFYWQKSISSESLSTSLLLIGLALTIPLFRSPPPSTWRVALTVPLLAPVMLLFAFTRDANAYVLLCLAGAAVVLAAAVPAARRLARPALALGLLTLLLVGLVNYSAGRGQRWKFCFVNLLAQRVLGNPARRAFFVERGMPENRKVLCFAGGWGDMCDGDWSGFGPWLDGDIRGVWERYLLSRPVEALVDPLRHCPELLCAASKADRRVSTLIFYFAVKEPPWQRQLNLFFFANCRAPLVPLVALVAVGVLLARRRRFAGRLLLPATLLLAVYPMIFFIWHADAMEPQRHAVLPVMLSRVGLWSAILLALDVLVERRTREPAPYPMERNGSG